MWMCNIVDRVCFDAERVEVCHLNERLGSLPSKYSSLGFLRHPIIPSSGAPPDYTRCTSYPFFLDHGRLDRDSLRPCSLLSYSSSLLSIFTHQSAVSALLSQLCFPLDPFCHVSLPLHHPCSNSQTCHPLSPIQAFLQINTAYSPKLTPPFHSFEVPFLVGVLYCCYA